MDTEVARTLIESLIQRLSRNGSHFHLPEGRLSENEVIALRALAGVPEPKSQEDTQPTIAAPTLDLSALSRPSVADEQIRLCLDFGTAMSKAWGTAGLFSALYSSS